LAIDLELVRGFEKDILHTLFDGLGINGPNSYQICQELSQELPRVAALREELNRKRERLSKAGEELLNINL
jgi:hypothetical protein